MVGVEKMEDTSRKDSAAKMGNAQIGPVEAQEAVSDLLARFDALKAAGSGLAPNFQAFVVNATAAFERLRSGRPLSRRERRQMENRAGLSGARARYVIVDDPAAEIGKPTAPLLTLDVQADTVGMRRVDYVDLVRELTTLRAQVEDLTARAATAGIKASAAGTYTEQQQGLAANYLARALPAIGKDTHGKRMTLVRGVGEWLGVNPASPARINEDSEA